MKILEPQSAILTNVEVLAHFSLNPPRRPPNPPPNSRNFTPSPDLRDHNTVVKEFHDYVTRLSPHLLSYPSFTPPKTSNEDNNNNNNNNTNGNGKGNTMSLTTQSQSQPQLQLQSQPTDLDIALREIIRRLRPFQLTKAEVLMIVNLGVGLDLSGEQGEVEVEDTAAAAAAAEGTTDAMEVDGEAGGEMRGVEGGGGGEEGERGEEEGVDEEADYGALALLDTVIEDREERLSIEDVGEILRVVRETLGSKGKGEGKRRSSTAGGG